MFTLVTGASGLLGRSVCRVLNDAGHKVFGVLRPGSNVEGIGCQPVAADVTDPGWIGQKLPRRIEAVVHLAQSRRFRDFPDGAADVFGVNVNATAQLLDYAVRSGASHFIYASSGGIYRRGEAPLTENAPLDPPGDLGFYLGSKAAAEILVQSYSSLLNVVILRPFFVYGPGQKRDMLIPRIFDSVRDAQPLRLDGDSGLSINPIHVDDAAIAVSRAISLSEGAVINIAGPETLTLREIALAFGEHIGREPIFEPTGEPNRSLLGSIDLMCDLLHAPQRRLRDSVGDIAVSS